MRSPEAVAGMPCPVCKTALAMSDRQGIEIDYCPTCRGVWLDRGELDKIIERSAPEAPMPPPPPQPPIAPTSVPRSGGYDQRYEQTSYDQRGYDPRYKQKRRKSFFEEIFD